MELKPHGRTGGAPCKLCASSYPGFRLPLFERGPPPWAGIPGILARDYRACGPPAPRHWWGALVAQGGAKTSKGGALATSPEFKGTTMQGENIDSGLFSDDLVILNFWFTVCGPCIREIPELNQLVEKYQTNIHYLAFSADSREQIQTFLKKHPFKFKIIPGAREVEKAFDISIHPTHVVIKNGRILWKGFGSSSDNIDRLEGIIKRNLEGNLK